MFILYVNNIYNVVNCELILHGDDFALLISEKDVNETETMLGQDLRYIISEWLESNKLSLHFSKTEENILSV